MSREPDERDERQAVRDWADMARAESAALRAHLSATRRRSRELLAEAAAISAPGQPVTVAQMLALTGLSAEDVWLKYAELGGDRNPDQVAAYLSGGVEWPAIETSILTHVLNERLIEQGLPTRSE